MPNWAQAQALSAAALFEKRCYSCHNIGGGTKQGPDLKGVTDRRSREWLHQFIQTPAELSRKGDATAQQLFKQFAPEVMPDQSLTPDQLEAVLDLIADLTRKNQQFIPAGAALSRPLIPSDISAGLKLFTGQTALRNGGPACIACHQLKDAGPLGGGTLGPDLTVANIKYRDPELIAIFQTPNFPTMNSVFAAHPLTDEEIVQLFALFQQAKQTNPAAPVGITAVDGKFPLIGFGLLALALVGINVIWKNRLRGVREEIVQKATGRAGHSERR